MKKRKISSLTAHLFFVLLLFTIGILFIVPFKLVNGEEESDQSSSKAPPLQFFAGRYDVVGRSPDSNQNYMGTTIIQVQDDILVFIKDIDGKMIEGKGRIETATADNVPVLRVRFIDEGINYETTYLIHSDLNNYARLTGYIYRQDNTTKIPGIEALFISN